MSVVEAEVPTGASKSLLSLIRPDKNGGTSSGASAGTPSPECNGHGESSDEGEDSTTKVAGSSSDEDHSSMGVTKDVKSTKQALDKTVNRESSSRPHSNGSGEARSEGKLSVANGRPLLQNEQAKPDVTPSPGPAVDENGEGGVAAEAPGGVEQDPESMDTSEVESNASSPSSESSGASTAASKPGVTTGASDVEIREGSLAGRIPNGSGPEQELPSVLVTEQSSEKSAPNSAPASNPNSHGGDVDDDDDDDDDEEGALVVDEGDSSPEAVEEKEAVEETPVPVPEVPASKEEKKLSPVPEERTRTESSGSKKRAISPAVTVTKKLKADDGSAQETSSVNANVSGSATVNAIANISASTVTEALCSADEPSSPQPPERLPEVDDMNLLDRMLLNARRDIRTLDQQIKEKEREWNLLLHRKKKMEEYYLRLRRKKEVDTLGATGALPSSAAASTAPAAAPNVTPLSVLRPATGISVTSKALSADKVENTVSIISSGMSGGKVKTVTQEPSGVTPRAMTITADMIYGANGKAKMGNSSSIVSVASQIQALNNSKSTSSSASSGRARNWRPPPNTVASSSAASLLSSVAKAATSNQAEMLQMYSEMVRQQQLQQQQQQQQQQQSSYQQAEKLQQALTGNMPRTTFQIQPSQLQQALGLGSGISATEATVAAAVVAAAASRQQRGNSSRVSGGAQESSTLASMLEAGRGRHQATDRSSAKSKSSGVNLSVSHAKKSESKEPAKSSEVHPTCHGCKQRMAQFVCAGCNSQWYCSRECQISDWDEHAEQCNG